MGLSKVFSLPKLSFVARSLHLSYSAMLNNRLYTIKTALKLLTKTFS